MECIGSNDQIPDQYFQNLILYLYIHLTFKGIGNPKRAEKAVQLIKSVGIKFSSNIHSRQLFEERCQGVRRYSPIKLQVPLQWKSIVDELVTALSARTLLLQFLAIARKRNKAQNKVREIPLRVVSYVGLLKRLDAIARILYGRLKSIEMIPL